MDLKVDTGTWTVRVGITTSHLQSNATTVFESQKECVIGISSADRLIEIHGDERPSPPPPSIEITFSGQTFILALHARTWGSAHG